MRAGPRLCIAVMLVAGSSLCANEAELAALVSQLGSPKFADREAASRKLKEIGDKALPALTQAKLSDNSEIRRRAELLLQAMRQRQDTERLLAAPKVRFKFENVPVPVAIDQIAAQTGVQIVLDGDRTALTLRTVTIDTGEVSFFQALEQFCRKTRLAERAVNTYTLPYGNPYSEAFGGRGIPWSGPSYLEPVAAAPSRIVLTDAKGQPSSPTFHTGAIRLRAPHAGLTQPPRHAFTLEVLADPKLPFRGVTALRIERALTEQGESLSVREVENPSNAGVLDHRQMPVRLSSAPKDCAKLSEVAGHLSVLVEKTDELIRVDGVREAAGKTYRASTGEILELLEIDTRGPHCWVQLRLKFSSASLPAQLAVAQFMRARRGFGSRTNADAVTGNILLFDAQGKALACSQTETNLIPRADGLVLECSMTFQASAGQGLPERLVYHGRRVVAADVPCVLRDVPLP